MTSQAVAQRPTNDRQPGTPGPITTLAAQLQDRVNQFRLALPSHITPEKFQRTVLTAVQSDPELLNADRQSLLLACMKAAQDGLLPDKREAALVVFVERKKNGNQWESRKLVQYMPMVYGLRKKILQSGEVSDITAHVVYRREYEEGTFYYEEGTDRQLRHKPNLALSDEDMADENIIAAYSMVIFKDGSHSYEVMRRAEINKVRQTSQTGAEGKTVKFGNDAGKPIPPKGPWVDWFSEMAKKTVMRRHSKTLPMSGDLIDVEGDEIQAAESASRVLAIEPQGGTTDMPSRDAPAQIEQSREVDMQLDREAFRQIDGETVDMSTGEVVDHELDQVATEVEQKAKRQRRAKEQSQRETEPNPNDGRGEAVTLASALDEINSAETIIDVNSRMSGLLPQLSDDDGAALRERAFARIEELKGGK